MHKPQQCIIDRKEVYREPLWNQQNMSSCSGAANRGRGPRKKPLSLYQNLGQMHTFPSLQWQWVLLFIRPPRSVLIKSHLQTASMFVAAHTPCLKTSVFSPQHKCPGSSYNAWIRVLFLLNWVSVPKSEQLTAFPMHSASITIPVNIYKCISAQTTAQPSNPILMWTTCPAGGIFTLM